MRCWRITTFGSIYLGCFVLGQATYLLMPATARTAYLASASTNVANLEHDPVGCLILSAFVTGGNLVSTLTWLPLIAIALFGAARAAGLRPAVGVCVAGHVIGTIVSEGIVEWRVHAGALPGSYLHLTDVGPSYVVVSALVVAIMRGPKPWKILAAADLALLVFPGQIFAGLTSLHVSAVGHATAIVTALVLSRPRRRRPGQSGT